ncbi:MAG: hypothetical protein Q4E63_00390 [Prevotellaceae bacterium]|nr:hypothetical protein [Prevotellaceae bacterium]MDO4931099.1 hypothetical protein [Prevotellaceae bacterium]
MIRRKILRLMLSALVCCLAATANADALAVLEATLNKPQIQEKVYVHTDNSAYFIGDTLWYKAYVVRADNLHPTNLSKLLYVELLTPDGYLVERQHIVVSDKGNTCGQFVLRDSLYSGYYEIRAYTRWQLNFNITKKDYTVDDRLKFYGKEAAETFFRDYEGLYSRVLPIYEKPKKTGDYTDRYMAKRPKQHVLKSKTTLHCRFYPEGGQLVEGLPCNVAFELTDNNGQQFDVPGTLSDGRVIKPTHMGRGQFTVTPGTTAIKATYQWNDKQYVFNLPKAQQTGATITLNVEKLTATVHAKGVTPAAYTVLCRGRLITFSRMNGAGEIKINAEKCPTGINELIVYDAEAQPLASRLFFVNHHDYGRETQLTLTAEGETVGRQTTLKPYAPVELSLTVPKAQEQWAGSFSIAVRDAQTDERGYDNGNIMTDMLLASELKGFIASPAYYFAADDEQHRADLDLLMKVQGWRRYKRADKLRYMPERGLTYDGTVYTIPEIADLMLLDDLGKAGHKTVTVADEMMAELEAMSDKASEAMAQREETEDIEEGLGIDQDATDDVDIEWADDNDIRLGSGHVRRAVLVEAEIVKDGETAGAIATTDRNGRFVINLPPFYDQAILFVKAYNRKDSLAKNMQSTVPDKGKLDERAFPDYFVRRNMFFPVFSQPYNWYQVNSPDLFFVDEDDDKEIAKGSRLAGNHTLQMVVVSGKRRGKRAINMAKPAIVLDMYEAYNNASDYGLMLGVADFKRIPMALATYFVGNMGRRNQFNIRAMVDGTSFYRNYTPMVSEYDKPRTTTDVFEQLRLSRIKNVRVYTDYDLRTDSGDVTERHSADVTLNLELVPDNGKRYTYRDRRYVIDGLTYPEAFYSPDYSMAIPEKPTDYRRTLYWNPNPKIAEDGTFKDRFYNNSRETRVTVSATGMDTGGEVYYK